MKNLTENKNQMIYTTKQKIILKKLKSMKLISDDIKPNIIPYFNTEQIKNFDYVCHNQQSIRCFPLLNTSNALSFNFSWAYCINIDSFPILDISKGMQFNSTWYWCSSLTKFPLLDISNGNIFKATWSGCKSMEDFPTLDLSNGTDFDYCWSHCESLTEFPFLNLSNATTFRYCWLNCYNLEHFPPNMFDNLTSSIHPDCFFGTWTNCRLTAKSVENILVSINKSKIRPPENECEITISMQSQQISNKTLNAIKHLKERNWNINITHKPFI